MVATVKASGMPFEAATQQHCVRENLHSRLLVFRFQHARTALFAQHSGPSNGIFRKIART
jgi:hypothetical protein